MKKQIRQGVFETNSSSTHSICIAKECELIIPKSINFSFGEFGWEQGRLGSSEEKASYLYTGLFANNRLEDIEKIKGVLLSKGIEVSFEFPIIEKRRYTNQEGVLVEYNHGENTGYVDHANELGSFLDAVCENEISLMNFLFSPLSFILTGNDNDEDNDVSISVSYPFDEYYKWN